MSHHVAGQPTTHAMAVPSVREESAEDKVTCPRGKGSERGHTLTSQALGIHLPWPVLWKGLEQML